MQKPKCLYAFRALTIGKQGSIAPCPSYRGNLGRIQETENLRAVYESHPELQALRETESQSQWFKPQCEACARSPGASAKQTFNNYMQANYPFLSKPDLDLTHLDIDFGNYTSHDVRPEDESWKLERPHIDRLLALCSTVTTIHIKGGEPLLEESFAYFLEGLIARDLERYRLTITTDFLKMNDRYAELLAKFKDPVININIDGISEMYHWVHGVPFRTIEEKLHAYLPKLRNAAIVFNHTTSVYNVDHLREFYQWAAALIKGLGIQASIQIGPIVKTPEFLSPVYSAATPKALEQIEDLITDPHQASALPVFQYSLKSLREFIKMGPQGTDEDLQRLVEWHESLVQKRGWDIRERISNRNL